jgi:hypothetical protein
MLDQPNQEYPKPPERHSEAVTISEISPLGYGTPEATISYNKKVENGQFGPEIIDRTIELIESGELIKPVEGDDDGCVDGRLARKTGVILSSDGQIEEQSFNGGNYMRAKVAGGGYITTLAMYLGMANGDERVNGDLRYVVSMLSSGGVCCGIHTGQHGHGEGATDCGANDNLRLILQEAGSFREDIKASVEALLAPADIKFNGVTLDRTIDGWSGKAAEGSDYFEGSTGKSRFQVVKEVITAKSQVVSSLEELKVISKELVGDHNEGFVILNYREGETFSQTALDKQLKQEFPGVDDSKLPKAFVVDVWRIKELAKALSNANEFIEFDAALSAGIAFQLATVATITDGSLRTFVIK